MENLFSYTNRNIEAARQEGLSKIPIISRGDWTDLNATDPGIILLDYVHALVDMCNYYQDHQALESFITTAKERVNIFRLAKQLSYKIRSAKGSVVDVEFYLSEIYTATIKIPKYTQIQADVNLANRYDSIKFLTTEDAYLLPGELSVRIPCVQGVLGIETYQGTGTSRYSDIAHPYNQNYTLSQKHVDMDTIEIIDNIGRVWKPVEYIIFSDTNDRVYQKDLNPDGTITIRFGDGERGVVPQVSDTLSISYVHSLAEGGRVGANTINTLISKIFDINGSPVAISINNLEESSGGSDVPEDSEIVEKAPDSIKAQNRAVTLKDFEALAVSIDGVEAAIAYDINKAPELCLYHEVKLIIIPTLGTPANAALLRRVYDYLYQRMIPPTNLQVLAPSEVTIDITLTVVRDQTYAEGGLEYAIKTVVEGFFRDKYKELGVSYNPNELNSAITKIPGVRYIASMSPENLVEIPKLSTYVLGNLTININ